MPSISAAFNNNHFVTPDRARDHAYRFRELYTSDKEETEETIQFIADELEEQEIDASDDYSATGSDTDPTGAAYYDSDSDKEEDTMKVQWITATLYDLADNKQAAYLKQKKSGTTTKVFCTREVIGSIMQNIQDKVLFKDGCSSLIEIVEKFKKHHGPDARLPTVDLNPPEPDDNRPSIVWRRYAQKEKHIFMIKHIYRTVRTEAINQSGHRFDNLVDNEGNIPTHYSARDVFDHLKATSDSAEILMTQALVLDEQIKSTTIDIWMLKTCLDAYFKTINTTIYDIEILGLSEMFEYPSDMLVELALKALKATAIRNKRIWDIEKDWKRADKTKKIATVALDKPQPETFAKYKEQRLVEFANHFHPKLALELADMGKDTVNTQLSARLADAEAQIGNAEENIDVIHSNT